MDDIGQSEAEQEANPITLLYCAEPRPCKSRMHTDWSVTEGEFDNQSSPTCICPVSLRLLIFKNRGA